MGVGGGTKREQQESDREKKREVQRGRRVGIETSQRKVHLKVNKRSERQTDRWRYTATQLSQRKNTQIIHGCTTREQWRGDDTVPVPRAVPRRSAPRRVSPPPRPHSSGAAFASAPRRHRCRPLPPHHHHHQPTKMMLRTMKRTRWQWARRPPTRTASWPSSRANRR